MCEKAELVLRLSQGIDPKKWTYGALYDAYQQIKHLMLQYNDDLASVDMYINMCDKTNSYEWKIHKALDRVDMIDAYRRHIVVMQEVARQAYNNVLNARCDEGPLVVCKSDGCYISQPSEQFAHWVSAYDAMYDSDVYGQTDLTEWVYMVMDVHTYEQVAATCVQDERPAL